MSRAGYRREKVELVRATCLYVATRLGDLMGDLLVVGGLVPSLLMHSVTNVISLAGAAWAAGPAGA